MKVSAKTYNNLDAVIPEDAHTRIGCAQVNSDGGRHCELRMLWVDWKSMCEDVDVKGLHSRERCRIVN